MNRRIKKYPKRELPKLIDTFTKYDDGYIAEYDGWHFEGKSIKAVTNKILRYIFNGGEE